MELKTLYLHIGRGKTGTSAIQKFLNANRETLREHDIHYVFADDTGRGIGHQDFAKSFIEKPPSFMKMPADPVQVRKAVAKELRQTTEANALLSSEHFTMVNVGEVAAFFAAQLEVVTIKVIFFARSQDELAESQYNQMIKLAITQKTFRDYIETELTELDFAAVLAPWAMQFGKDNIIARVYDASRPTIIQEFLSTLGLAADSTSFTSVEASNESVGYLALEMFRILNGFNLPRRHRIYPLLEDAIKPIDLPPLFFDSAQAAAFRDRFSASNEIFIREYLGGPGNDLGKRKYSATERDKIYASIQKLRSGGGTSAP